MRRTPGTAPRKFAPRLEALEDRWCPATQVYPLGGFLLVVGDEAADAITLSDNGRGLVSVTADGTTTNARNVFAVAVFSGGGGDTVNYTLSAPLASFQNVYLDLAEGNDRATLNFSPGVSGAILNAAVTAGEGNDQVTATLGTVNTFSLVNLSLAGDAGNDQLTANVGSTGLLSLVNAFLDGGDGNDRLTANVGSLLGAVEFLSGVNVSLSGGAGSDNLNAVYLGRLSGALALDIEGGEGGDVVFANLGVGPGSTGTLAATVRGDAGNDLLTLNVLTLGASLASLEALIDGGDGFDVCFHTSNVEDVNCEI